MRRDTAGTPALAIDGKTLEGLAQAGINALTCPGVGGVAAVALGIMDNPTFKDKGKMSGAPLDNATLAALPKDPITIESEGNMFLINIQDQSIEVNGRAVVSFGIILGLHGGCFLQFNFAFAYTCTVLFITLAFFVVLPIYIVMGAVMRLSIMINFPFNEDRNKKWRTILLLFFFIPLAIIGLVLGFVAVGNSRHMRTAHGVS